MSLANLVVSEHSDTGWLSGKFWFDGESYSVNAKVYDEGSRFGIGGGRVSKLQVGLRETGREIYNYDRGLDHDESPGGLIAELVAQLEKIPCQ